MNASRRQESREESSVEEFGREKTKFTNTRKHLFGFYQNTVI